MIGFAYLKNVCILQCLDGVKGWFPGNETLQIKCPPVFNGKFDRIIQPAIVGVKYFQAALYDKSLVATDLTGTEDHFLLLKRPGLEDRNKPVDLFLVKMDH